MRLNVKSANSQYYVLMLSAIVGSSIGTYICIAVLLCQLVLQYLLRKNPVEEHLRYDENGNLIESIKRYR